LIAAGHTPGEIITKLPPKNLDKIKRPSNYR